MSAMAMHDEALLCIWISFLGFALDKSAGSAALVHTLRRFPAPAPPHSYHQGRGLERWTLRCANSLRMRGGDGNDAEEVDKGWGTYDLDAKDPFLDDGEENDRPWPEEANAKDEDQQLARGMKERLILGENKWYDDMYAGVDKNKYGDYDMHFDKDKDSDSSEVESSEKDEIERILEDNPEGYLGQVDEEGKKRLYPYLKEKYKYYERNVTLEERPPQHQFRVGDLVTLSKDFKTFNVSKYLKPGRDDVSDLDSDLPLNDAQFGPLKPEDVGVIVEDDNALKPYLVRALDSKTLKDGCPPEFVDTWWYLPEVLQRYHPPQKIEFAPDATIEIPRDFPSVKLAMKNLSEGQSLFVRSGDYRYEEAIEIGDHPKGRHPLSIKTSFRTLNMTGEARSRSWGRLIFGLWAHGRIETMTMLHTTNLCFTGCVEVHAGPWKFRKSQFRSAGGIAIKLMSEGNVSCIACGVGGFAWPISLNSAADGIYCSGKSQCQLTRCTVDKTGRASGLGVYAQDRSAVVAMDTNFDQNDRAIGYNDEACFVLYKCTITRTRNEAFYSGLRSMKSTLILRSSRIEGPLWFRGRLPGELGLTGDYPGDNIMGPLPEQPMTDLPGSHGKLLLPTIDDRLSFRANLLPVNWEPDHY
mmetsp:Transcript_25863/g.85192  ORF Transcript_25863/g.85192 Transcript_25863/m.85192 type:complete len:638 (-) Transcript_25863:212-2125(-)